MFITKKSISRRTVLRGMGATIALPFLEAMVPASANAQEASKPVKRFQAFYVPNGMAMEGRLPGCQGCHGAQKDNDYLFTGRIK